MEQPLQLPDSGCIPFLMDIYTIGLDSNTQMKYEQIIDKLKVVKSVKKMDKMLVQCKDLIMGLKFFNND